MVNILGLADAINRELKSYSEEVTENVKRAVDTVSKEVNEEIKSHVTFKKRRGEYVKSFRVGRTFENKHKRVRTWYVANGEHRLTHLLEKGHALNIGGRARAYPHIKYGAELAEKRMMELVEKGV